MKFGKNQSSIVAISYEKIAFFFIWVGIILVLVHVVLFYWDGLLFRIGPPEILQAMGQFGEYMSGMIGAIWSLASVILFYEALKFQRRELTLQRHELELNRNELLEQTQQFRDQNHLLMLQNTESTFFQLLALHNDIVKSINIIKYEPANGPDNKKVITGRDCFIEYYGYFKYIYSMQIDDIGVGTPSQKDMIDNLKESFDNFLVKYHAELGHYLRNVSNIIEFLDNSKLENKKFYKKLLISQLSDYELLLLFYFCFSAKGKDFKPLVEKYSIFLNINREELLDQRHQGLFEPEAFDENA